MQHKQLSPIQNDEQAEKDFELVEQGVSKLKKFFVDFPRAILNLSGHYRKFKQAYKDLQERYNLLSSDYESQSRELQCLENAQRQLNEQINQLQDKINERDRRIQTQYQTINQKDLKIQELKGASYTTVCGDSKTTYAQWIDKYCNLYLAYRKGVLEVVDPARFDEVYNEITTILEKGLKDELLENELPTAQERFALYLKDDADLPDDARDRLSRFVEELFDTANSAEAAYKESFILCNLSGTRFDFNYARTPERPMAEKKGDKGKKIVHCYLPAIFFYFKNEQVSACAPALVGLEEENNNDGLGSR